MAEAVQTTLDGTPSGAGEKLRKAILYSGEETGGYLLLLLAQFLPDCAKILPEHQYRSPHE